ncbi:MAG: glycyl-radical enzyme activating protein [Candidatus Magnetomorum sp.]|nr:glycyl-radical enzyme activating protein [Candidatus Magnetomorum sp.]
MPFHKKAFIANIQRMSMDDGPGIRSTVFFKGCSLKCSWCHNPETISSKPHVQWHPEKCLACHVCMDTCPENAILESEHKQIQISSSCNHCGSCVDACPGAALEMIGQYQTVDEIMLTLKKDMTYYHTSGGGVTLSGGEPCLQSEMVSILLGELKQAGIHTALDTCGYCDATVFKKLLPETDLILYDIKEIDPDRHVEFTAHSNKRIIQNLKDIVKRITDNHLKTRVWIRTPIIPGGTGNRENITGIGQLISTLPREIITRWDLCAFNPLCQDKYERLGLIWPFKEYSFYEKQQMLAFFDMAKQACVNPDIVHWSGYTQNESKEINHS